MKALLYIRVSSKDQRDGYSLDAQEKLGQEYAQRKNLSIAKSWKVSESAWRSERTAFNLLVEYAKRHDEVKHIIFDVTDRMTRNDFDKLKIYTLIKEYGKTIHLARSNKIFDRNSGSEEEFMLDIEVAVAKKQSNDISRKTKMGLMEKAEQGLYPSVAPLGYRNNLVTHLIEVDEDRAPFIRRAFTLMASGSYSLDMIAKTLYQEGFRGKKGHRVGKSGIEWLLKNPIYYGAFRWRGQLLMGSHAPLITKDLFDRAQDALHGKARPHASRRGFAFNNLVVCGKCGCKVLGEIKKKRFVYYHCTFSKGRHDGWGYVPENRIAHLFEPSVRAVTLDDGVVDWLKDALREADKKGAGLRENRVASLQRELEKASQRLSRLYDARMDGELDEEAFKAKEGEYRANIAEIKALLNGLGKVNPNWYENASKTLELSNRLYPQYLKSKHEGKAAILKFVASNYTFVDATIVPTYRKPFGILAEGLLRPKWLPRQDSNLGHGGYTLTPIPRRVGLSLCPRLHVRAAGVKSLHLSARGGLGSGLPRRYRRRVSLNLPAVSPTRFRMGLLTCNSHLLYQLSYRGNAYLEISRSFKNSLPTPIQLMIFLALNRIDLISHIEQPSALPPPEADQPPAKTELQENTGYSTAEGAGERMGSLAPAPAPARPSRSSEAGGRRPCGGGSR